MPKELNEESRRPYGIDGNAYSLERVKAPRSYSSASIFMSFPGEFETMAATPPICDFGWKAPDFTLPATDGKIYSLQKLMGENGLVLAYICNHCPYVIAVKERLIRDANDLKALGINFVGINANDAIQYPADSFEKMKEENYPFPYLYDESQQVARAYDAICTPDFFGFNKNFELQYRGRLDESKKDTASPDVRRDLYEAMKLVAETSKGPRDQIASMGCSIKWRA